MRRKSDASAFDTTSACDYNNDEMQYGQDEAAVDSILQCGNQVPEAALSTKVNLQPSTTIESLLPEANYITNNKENNGKSVELELRVDNGKTYPLSEHPGHTRVFDLDIDSHHSVVSSSAEKRDNMSVYGPDNCCEDDLLLGASASPTAGEMPSGSNSDVPPHLLEPDYADYTCVLPHQLIAEHADTMGATEHYTEDDSQCAGGSASGAMETASSSSGNSYVGLVNQAMTCYLNSLVQALFMTPEFRNAIYNWEFDGQNESRSIPYQLQKLFLNLQTSTRSAVETTDLTTSFGWQGSDAWHQHDIQELCRVMFDALERKFKYTKQANLINDLYEGTMLDYVKCLECGREKSRRDTFLDIPLPVRPFGSTVAYNSVEEALRGFVQPETLDGNNQYFCERCNKKCDAHKGLKFIKFPYLLTLHLKRFDFDYNTMHRIKLNDKVVFPERLNLNSFVPNNRGENEVIEDRETVVKCDDCSTTDSGSALDDESCQGTDVSSSAVNEHEHDENCEDSDEGIDVSSGTTHAHHHVDNEADDAKGPYVYELFSIMIHSGSASGGHYYAYIKDFDHNQWMCFNDQSVNRITQDDIQKTYGGGGSQKSYYPGAYTSSTNAYMLMYRQIDAERNRATMKVDEFPPHMQKLLQHMRERERVYRMDKEKQNNSLKLTVYCYHPITGELNDVRLNLYSDSTLEMAATLAHKRFKLEGLVQVDDCRMVVYNRKQSCIDCSFESDDLKFCDIVDRCNAYYSEWFLEIREPGTDFKTYKGGGIDMRVYYVEFENEELREPFLLRVDVDDTVRVVKQKLAESFCMDVSELRVAIERLYNEPQLLTDDSMVVPFDNNSTEFKLFVCNTNDEDPEVGFEESRFYKIIKKFDYIVHIGVLLPDTDPIVLDSCYIPSLESSQSNIERLDTDRGTNSPALRVSPQPGGAMVPGLNAAGLDTFGGDQSNSEDSSLSDSDRTLVGDAPGECQGPFSSHSTSPADQHMTSPMDPAEDSYNYDVLGNPAEEMNWNNSLPPSASMLKTPPYFKVTSVCECNRNLTPDTTHTRLCRVFVETRMTLETFKKHLEPTVRVPKEYFKVYRQNSCVDEEWSCLNDTLHSVRDGHTLIIRLGRALSINEVNCKIYLLKPESTDVDCFLFDYILSKGSLVGHVKRDILLKAKKLHMLDIPYGKCRLREKYLKKPRKIYLDDLLFGSDIVILNNSDIYLQQLTETDRVKSMGQSVVFVRRWRPATLTLDAFQEVVLENGTAAEFKAKLVELASDVPVEFVQYALVKSGFPCDMHLLDIDGDLDWECDQLVAQAEDGTTFFFKDSREKLKELSYSEKKEINIKENQRLGRFSSRGGHTSERSLRIYLDSVSDGDDMD